MQVTPNAISENRFDEAGFYCWIISLDLPKDAGNKQEWYLQKFPDNERLSQQYYAYNTIHKYLEEPFTSYMPEALFNISHFLLVETSKSKPPGVSSFAIIFTLAKQTRKLGANKLAKQMFDKIMLLRVPKKFEEQVEIATIASRARPYNDAEELLPMCYRCSTYNPLSSTINSCINCGQPFVFSFVSFELLPLIEFSIEDGLSDEEAIRLIETPGEAKNEGFTETLNEDQQTLELKNFDDSANESDPFVYKFINSQEEGKTHQPIVLNRKNLLALETETVLICKWASPLRWQFYKNILPELHVTLCNSCFKAFHVDDFELQLLQKGFCPFCRVSPDNIGLDSSGFDDLVV